MAAPIKPWERNSVPLNQSRASLEPSVFGALGSPVPVAAVEQSGHQDGRPPVPPRISPPAPTQGSLYGGHTMGGYGGLYPSSPFMGGYGAGFSPYNRLGYGPTAPNSFVQLAESNAQGAFQSVESVVSAVSSISMMLESTYFALHNSFRAVLGVADQFSRLKLQLTQLAASFAVFRFIRWLYRRLLVLLGLRKAGLSDDAWANALKKTAKDAQQQFPGSQKSTWPLVVFFAITFGGPILIWRMLQNLTGYGSKWADGSADHVVGECKFDFVGERDDELTVKEGQRLNLAPADMQPRLHQNDWLLASVDGTKTGVVPASYVTILGTRKGKSINTAASQPPIETTDKSVSDENS